MVMHTQAAPTTFSMPSTVTGTAYKNGCTSNCALVIMLHGINGNGPDFATDAGFQNTFTGIIAYPSETDSNGGWPTSSSDSHWASNLAKMEALIAMPEVDQSKVYLLGFSNGGFFAFALMCAIGDRLRGIAISAGLYEQQTLGCPHRTNLLQLHNANDNYNLPIDPPASKGVIQWGVPTSIRREWLDATTYPDASTNGASGVTTGDFTLYAATQGNLRFDYYSYNGPAGHMYLVYSGSPSGAPGGMAQNAYINSYLTALSTAGSSPTPTPTPAPPTSSPTTSPGSADDAHILALPSVVLLALLTQLLNGA